MPRAVVTYDAGTWDVNGAPPSSSPVTVTDASLSTSDITTNNATSAKHGFLPKLSNAATDFLDGTGAYDTVKDSDLSTSDITTNNVATSKHGFAPKLPNDATKYLDGTGAYSVPPGTGSGGYTESVYTEFTSSVNVTATTEATANTLVTGSAFTADGTSAYLIEFFSVAARPDNTVASRSLTYWLYQDGSSIGRLGFQRTPAAASADQPVQLARRMIPASGSRTYSVRASVSAGTGVVVAGAGGTATDMPGYIRVTKVT